MNTFYTKPSLLDFSSAHEPSEQDFNINIWGPIIEVIFSNTIVQVKRVGASIATEKKSTLTNSGHADTDHHRIAKLDRENDVAPPARVDVSVGKAIQQGRQGKGITQKDLAQLINEKPQVVNDYESGKAIPNQNVLGKMERAPQC